MEAVQTESSGKLATIAKCAHAPCVCTVSSGERFCSDYCIEQAGAEDQSAATEAGDHDCGCGHAECEHLAHSKSALGIALGEPVVS